MSDILCPDCGHLVSCHGKTRCYYFYPGHQCPCEKGREELRRDRRDADIYAIATKLDVLSKKLDAIAAALNKLVK